MNRTEHIRLMATYNEWINTSLYHAAGQLTDTALAADRQAFFGSILGTLNHIIVADRVWLKRFANHPTGFSALTPIIDLVIPTALNQILYTDMQGLAAHRKLLDQIILQWVAEITESDLDHLLQYSNMKGVKSERSFFGLLMHFFNHQTHHRGQATTLLFQAGVDPGITDLLVLVPDHMQT